MSTSGLTRRVRGLEQIAKDVQRREIRDLVRSLPEARDLTFAELDEPATLVFAALDARLTSGQFAEQVAERMGLDAQELLSSIEGRSNAGHG